MSDTNSNAEHDSDAVHDVGEEQLARIYAKAFLGAAEATGNVDGLVGEIDSLLEDVLDPFPEFEVTLGAPSLTHDERIEIIDAVFKSRASEPVLNFLKVLSQNDRTSSLRAVARMIHKLHGESLGRHKVLIHTAQPLDASLLGELKNTLQAKLGIEPELSVQVNPDLIGGLMIQLGDKVYDGSVRTALAKTRQQMVEKAIHAIEKNPEKFLSDNVSPSDQS